MGYKEQDATKVAGFTEKILKIPTELIVYVDECGIEKYLYREYGRAERGTPMFSQFKFYFLKERKANEV